MDSLFCMAVISNSVILIKGDRHAPAVCSVPVGGATGFSEGY